jgi:N6-L-threonylcarbamoyladenine synthase
LKHPAASCILAIESSCDETSAAVLTEGKLRSNIIATQSIHEKYGGVVPELASRDHQKHIVPVVTAALAEAKVEKNRITAVAFTQGPGLMGSLLVGSSFAKALALGWGVPLIAVNHMQAHVLAHFLADPAPVFPFLCLTVSGGHTQLVVVEDYLQMHILGETRDDAVGEAFDKTAKLLGLPYPGGPLIDKLAQSGNPQAFTFPLTEMPAYDFSFSGIKTAFLYFLQEKARQDSGFIQNHLPDLCASVQYTLVTMLIRKLRKAAQDTGIRQIALAGGVAANSGLRKTVRETGTELGWEVFIPAPVYCTDNAAMIGMAAYYKALAGEFSPQSASPDAGMLLK